MKVLLDYNIMLLIHIILGLEAIQEFQCIMTKSLKEIKYKIPRASCESQIVTET